MWVFSFIFLVEICSEVYLNVKKFFSKTSVLQDHWTAGNSSDSLHVFFSKPCPSNQSEEAKVRGGSSRLSMNTWTHFWLTTHLVPKLQLAAGICHYDYKLIKLINFWVFLGAVEKVWQKSVFGHTKNWIAWLTYVDFCRCKKTKKQNRFPTIWTGIYSDVLSL